MCENKAKKRHKGLLSKGGRRGGFDPTTMATRCTQRPGSVAGIRFFDVATINIHRTMDTAQIGMNCIFACKE